MSPAVMRASLATGDVALSREAVSDGTDRKLSSKLFFSAFSYHEYTSSTVLIWYIHLSVYVYVRI